MSAPGPPPPPPDDLPEANVNVRARRHFQLVWLIPIVAALVGAWLGYRALADRGEEIVIRFASGDGLVAGQTKVRHKAVELGTVRTVSLSDDLRTVDVRIDMLREADRFLTERARFWVVRPRLTGSSVSGLDTLLSGSYIEMDPGASRGQPQNHFDGLDEPPAVRSDEPGTTFDLHSDRIGSLSSGAPVFFRDVVVGEVLGNDPVQPGRPIILHVFVRHPFDGYVRAGTHFWNASGLSVSLGGSGLSVKLQSLQALLSGGVAFDTPPEALRANQATNGRPFDLYADENEAIAAGYSARIPFVTYFDSSVRGLTVGSAVEFYGIQVGTVTTIRLDFDPTGAHTRVAVRMEVQPERFMRREDIHSGDNLAVAQRLVDRGMRAQLRSANLLTGQQLIAFDVTPGAPPGLVVANADGIVIPSSSGGLDSITASLAQVANKIDSLPLEQIGRNLNATLEGASRVVNNPQLGTILAALAATTKRLPDVAQGLQATVERTSRLAASVQSGYGTDSQFSRDVSHLLDQVSEAARSVRLLADYLDQHPEALLRGRLGRSEER